MPGRRASAALMIPGIRRAAMIENIDGNHHNLKRRAYDPAKADNRHIPAASLLFVQARPSMPCILLHVAHVLGRGNSLCTGVTHRSPGFRHFSPQAFFSTAPRDETGWGVIG